VRQRPPEPEGERSEQRSFGLRPEVSSVEVLLQRVVHGQNVLLAALLVQAQLPALALGEVVVDLETERGADAGEAVNEHSNERAVAQAPDGVDFDRIQ